MELYVHIPFCVQKCKYCDFLSFPVTESLLEEYLSALEKEIKSKSVKDQKVSAVFIGGGTPSILQPSQIHRLMDALYQSFAFEQNVEITMEANPGTITTKKARTAVRAGINRMSLGLQSAQDEDLKKLGRIHSWEQFLESYDILRTEGLKNINIDIMSGLPKQNIQKYEDTLEKVCALNPEHISAYSLIIEEGTEFYDLYKEKAGTHRGELPDEDTERAMYDLTGEKLKRYGYERYEISNYSRKGYECQHNIGYWRRIPYLGFGLGASSFWNQIRFQNTKELEKYLRASEFPKEIAEQTEHLSLTDQMEEFMYLGLRMTNGVSISEFQENFHKSMESIYGKIIEKYRTFGLLEVGGGRLRLTKRGIDVSNIVLSEFILDK